jgi:hypothetical protein
MDLWGPRLAMPRLASANQQELNRQRALLNRATMRVDLSSVNLACARWLDQHGSPEPVWTPRPGGT